MNADPYNAFITRVEPGPAGEGLLAGRTLAVKDLFDTAGIRTTYGSGLYADHVPERNATAVQRLLDAGAVIVGKTHLPEFAWSVLGQSEWFGTCHNPTHPGKTTGGSSSGSAAALAAGLCELALGSDTGCSIRLPSATCEVVGLKSQWGFISTDGVFPLVPTLDTVGPMARSVEDVALMWSVLTERPVPEPRLAGLTIGLLRQPPGIGDGRETERSDAAEAWVGDLERLGARVVETRIPDATANTWPQFQHEALQSHAATFPSRADEYGELMQKKLRAAQRATAEEIDAAYRAIEEWRRYEPEVDLYISPCYAVELPPEDADELEVRLPLTSFLRWVNLTGWAGLAIGNMQLVGPRDEVVLAAGLAWERG
jgi:aspartyl-tRNA(Asn)/glutamyl-tRNA(Gln) amidotransferase subunit A